MKTTKFFFLFLLVSCSKHLTAQDEYQCRHSRDLLSLAPNNVTFECDVFRNEKITVRVYKANDSSCLIGNQTGVSRVEYGVTLTPSNEVYFVCIASDDSMSGRVYFAAIPNMPHIKPELALHLSRNNSFSLRCPFELGIARDFITPYHYVWFINNNVERNQKNQTFEGEVSEDMSGNVMYSCGVKIKECSAPCCSTSDYPLASLRPTFEVVTIETLTVLEVPESLNVSVGDSAEFNCSANGTNVSFEWEYMNTNYTYIGNGCPAPAENPCVMEDMMLSRFFIPSVSRNAVVRCIVRQSFNESYENPFVDIRPLEAELMVFEEPTPQTSPTMPTTTMNPFTTTERTGVNDSGLMIAYVSLGVVAVLAITVAATIVLSLTFHYHYKYKTDSKLGRFLSRAVSSRPSHRVNRESDLPSNGNGEVLSSVFQPARDYHCLQSRSGSQDQEQIYNASQYSKSSGGSYSGLSGVSNQEPGAVHKMPHYCATDVSGGSANNPQSSITTGGLLAPPHSTRGSNASRSQRSSDISDGSNPSQSKAIIKQPRLTQELLNQMQKAVSFEGVNGPQSYGGYPNYQLQSSQPHHHSDHGYLSQQRQSQVHVQPPLKLLPKYSPVGAAVSTKSPFIQGKAPFPHCRTPQNETAPFPSKHTNNEQRISEDTIDTVMKCLMHNKDCRIPNCLCHKVREKYKSTTGKHNPNLVVKQQSNSSDSSDSVLDKKKSLHLSLSPKATSQSQERSQDDLKVHPHYHRGAKSRARSTNPMPALERRRSKSVDLSPLEDCSGSPAKTPTVGASLIAGTPVLQPRTFEDAIANPDSSKLDSDNMPYRRLSPRSADSEQEPVCYDQGSMSADDLPTLCLNDCPLANTYKLQKLRPPPVKRNFSGKSKLSPIGEKHKETESDAMQGSYSVTYPKNYSDCASANSGGFSCSTLSQDNFTVREISQGCLSETLAVNDKLKPKVHRNLSSKCGSDHSQRSTSPAYETIVTVSDDGNRVHTTEC